jgi:phenylalanine-4-hydroxylase
LHNTGARAALSVVFEEAQLYAPVTRTDDGSVTVHLGEDHPGATDVDYRRRRNAIAELALDWQQGQPVPRVQYLPAEHEVWALVSAELHRLHEELACSEYLEGKERLGLPEDHIPQLAEVTDLLGRPISGFEYLPAAGLVPLRDFYGSLASGRFYSTQYMRHHSVPLYTPEPDVVHEVIGHANCLAHEGLAALYRAAGAAINRVATDEAVEFVSKVFWFSLEFGVLRERERVRTYGAGLLSSFGEIQQIERAILLPLDIARMGTQTYDITHYQPVLFCADSFAEVSDVVGAFFNDVDDDLANQLQASAPAPVVPSAV